MTDNKLTRNKVFLWVLGIVVISLLTAGGWAQKQTRLLAQHEQTYQQGVATLQSGDFQKAIQLFSSLPPGYGDSFQALYYTAFAYSHLKDFSQARNYMQKAQEARPAFLADPQFLVEYGEILYETGDFELSRLYLTRALNLGPTQETIDRANGVMAKLANSTGEETNGQ